MKYTSVTKQNLAPSFSIVCLGGHTTRHNKFVPHTSNLEVYKCTQEHLYKLVFLMAVPQ